MPRFTMLELILGVIVIMLATALVAFNLTREEACCFDSNPHEIQQMSHFILPNPPNPYMGPWYGGWFGSCQRHPQDLRID